MKKGGEERARVGRGMYKRNKNDQIEEEEESVTKADFGGRGGSEYV